MKRKASRKSRGKRIVTRYLTIMDSMSRDELEGKKAITEPRVKVIARGSGTSMVEVQMLLEEYKNIGKMIGNLSGLNMGQGRRPSNSRQRNAESDEKPAANHAEAWRSH